MEDPSPAEELGVAVALEKICSLESRLRQAIQSTHTLHRSFGKDLEVVDREREALLLIREYLELLEDKLREYRTMAMDPRGYDDKAIALSQLDSLRKELLRTAKDKVDFVFYNKNIVKDILAFADTGSSDELPAEEERSDAANLNGSAQTPPLSPILSEENDYFSSGNNRDGNSSQRRSGTSRGSGASKKDAQMHMHDLQENMFPFHVSASTPSLKAIQTRASSRGPAESSSQASLQEQRHLPPGRSSTAGFESTGTSLSDFLPTGTFSSQAETLGSKGSWLHGDDPSFGGKVSLTSFKGREKEKDTQEAIAADHTGHPRILPDSTRAEPQKSREDDVPPASQMAGSNLRMDEEAVESPIQRAMQRRAAAEQGGQQREKSRRRWGFLSVINSCVKLALAGAVGAATAVTISMALRTPKYWSLLPQPLPGGTHRSHKGRKSLTNSPRADGQLVPDWMHRSHFKTTERPPTGTLTAAEEPPGGEMFPVIPPPQGLHMRG